MNKQEAYQDLKDKHKNAVFWLNEEGEGATIQQGSEFALFEFLREELQIDDESIEEACGELSAMDRANWALKNGYAAISMAFDD